MADGWRNLDGTYTVRHWDVVDEPLRWVGHWVAREDVLGAGGRWDDRAGAWVVPESVLGRFGIRRCFVVIAAGHCCGRPVRAVAREGDLRRGKLFRVFCGSCGKRPEAGTLWEVPIVEVCGEGEEGQRTYEAAFRDAIEGR